jgi:hypothetical protein
MGDAEALNGGYTQLLLQYASVVVPLRWAVLPPGPRAASLEGRWLEAVAGVRQRCSMMQQHRPAAGGER